MSQWISKEARKARKKREKELIAEQRRIKREQRKKIPIEEYQERAKRARSKPGSTPGPRGRNPVWKKSKR